MTTKTVTVTVTEDNFPDVDLGYGYFANFDFYSMLKKFVAGEIETPQMDEEWFFSYLTSSGKINLMLDSEGIRLDYSVGGDYHAGNIAYSVLDCLGYDLPWDEFGLKCDDDGNYIVTDFDGLEKKYGSKDVAIESMLKYCDWESHAADIMSELEDDLYDDAVKTITKIEAEIKGE